MEIILKDQELKAILEEVVKVVLVEPLHRARPPIPSSLCKRIRDQAAGRHQKMPLFISWSSGL